MPVVTKDEIVRRLSERMGDDTSDDALALIEDVTDTYTDLETRVGDDWKTRYEENDKMWREKYRNRFMNKEEQEEFEEEFKEEERKDLSFDSLFSDK